MTKKKKIIILSCMIALLAVTAVFNFVFTAPVVDDDAISTSGSNYFTQYRNERLSNRNEELIQLDAIIASATEDSIERNQALALKTELTEITEKEMLLENLIKAFGFEDAVVVIGIDSGNINVITKTADLTTDDAIKIYSIIADENIASPENVKIIPIS